MGEGERGVRNGRNSKGRENWRRRTTERERERSCIAQLCDSSRYFFLKGGEDESDGRDTRTTV